MTTSDVRHRIREAAESVRAATHRLAQRRGVRGVALSIHSDRVRVSVGDVAMEARLLAAMTAAKESIMSVLDDLRAAQAATKVLLGDIATVIDTINTDLSDLLARLANSTPGSQEVMDATADANEIRTRMQSAVEALRAAEGRYTPGAEPPVIDPPVSEPPIDPPGEIIEP